MHTIKDTHSICAFLTHAWLSLGKWLNHLFLLLLAVGLGGWAIGNLCYAWKFSGLISVEEQIAPDEARITQAIVQDAIRAVEQHRDSAYILCSVHTKAHDCAKAELRVYADLDPILRRGVFAEVGKSWNAQVRFSNGNVYPQFDSKNDARDMAIKLLDVPGGKLLLGRGHDGKQDFVMFNQPVSFIRDIAEYRQNFAARADDKKALAFLPNWNPTSWELRHLLVALRTLAPAPDSPLHAGYSGISPCKLGEHNIKSRVVPAPERYLVHQLPKQNQDLPNFLRAALYQQLSTGHTPVCCAFQVQRQGPGKHMPIEDTSAEWEEPDIPLATITDIIVSAQDFGSREQNLFCDNPSFNPQHALPEHRPIDGIDRLRKVVYEAISGCKLGRNGRGFRGRSARCCVDRERSEAAH